MPNTLLNKKLTLANGSHVNVMATGNPGSENDSNDWVFLIQGGPGLSMAGIEEYVSAINDAAGKTYPCHFILFDPLSSGESDQAKHPDVDYTPDAQTEVAAQVVEAVAKELKIKHMNLKILSRSAGGIVAMNIPKCRPQWVTDETSAIQLKQIIPVSMPIDYRTIKKSVDYVRDHYKHLPNQNEILSLMAREYRGGIKTDDKNKDFALLLAAYSVLFSSVREKFSHTFWFKVQKFMVQHAYGFTTKTFKFFSPVSPEAKMLHGILCKSSVDALNHFNKNKGYHFDIADVVRKNKSIFEKVRICGISGMDDHVANPMWGTNDLVNELPNNFSYINFNGRHGMDEEFPKEFFTLVVKLLVGELQTKDLTTITGPDKAIYDYHLSPQLAQSTESKVLPSKSNSSFFAAKNDEPAVAQPVSTLGL